MKIFLILGVLLTAFTVQAATLRIEGERAWLKAKGTPLSKVLQLFEQRGAQVLIDPSLELGRIDGEWDNTKVERLISQLVSPNSYSIQWKLVQSPLGELYQISTIRVFGDKASAAKPISSPERVLDVVEGTNGVKYVRGEILVGFKDGSTVKDLNALLRKLNGTVIEVIDPPGIYRIRLNDDISVEEALKMASEHPGVDSSEPNLAISNENHPAVPISGTHADFNLGLAPSDSVIAVLDSGLDPQYKEMDFVLGTYDALNGVADIDDPTGHGTLVSLIAAGVITPLGEQAGDTGTSVLSIKIYDPNGVTSSDAIFKGINYAINSGAGSLVTSFGSEERIGFLENGISVATASGLTTFSSSGNNGGDQALYPAASFLTISVGANDRVGNVAVYSNRDADIFYSGTVIYDGEKHYGTSFSNPYAAYLYAIKPDDQ